MNVDKNDLDRRARLHAALGDSLRLGAVEALRFGDLAPGELASRLGIGTNLLAHHLNLLEEVGLVARQRSEGDGRRTYVRLVVGALAAVAPVTGGSVVATRVVFVCSQNSARSQLAHAAWRRASTVASASAGTHPAARVHPAAVEAGRRHGLSLSGARTHHVDDVLQPQDLVVAVCDAAHEELAARGTAQLHWSVPDPVPAVGRDAFERAVTEIEDRVGRLAATVRPDDVEHSRSPA